MKVAATIAIVLAGTCVVAAAIGARAPAVNGELKCAAPDVRVVVDLQHRTLALCDKDNLVDRFAVRLGRFGTFIPIGFPAAS